MTNPYGENPYESPRIVDEPVVMAELASQPKGPPTLLEALHALAYGLLAVILLMGIIFAAGMCILWLVA